MKLEIEGTEELGSELEAIAKHNLVTKDDIVRMALSTYVNSMTRRKSETFIEKVAQLLQRFSAMVMKEAAEKKED